jgi:Protein of unknown function (DUF2934)
MSKTNGSSVRPPTAIRPPQISTSPNGSAHVTDREVTCRAYDLYLARGCEHGHDLDDWLQAERELSEEVARTPRSI